MGGCKKNGETDVAALEQMEKKQRLNYKLGKESIVHEFSIISHINEKKH